MIYASNIHHTKRSNTKIKSVTKLTNGFHTALFLQKPEELTTKIWVHAAVNTSTVAFRVPTRCLEECHQRLGIRLRGNGPPPTPGLLQNAEHPVRTKRRHDPDAIIGTDEGSLPQPDSYKGTRCSDVAYNVYWYSTGLTGPVYMSCAHKMKKCTFSSQCLPSTGHSLPRYVPVRTWNDRANLIKENWNVSSPFATDLDHVSAVLISISDDDVRSA